MLTEEQILFIRKNFANMRNQDIADALGISKSAVSRVQKKYHLLKSPEQRIKLLTKAGKIAAMKRGNKPPKVTPEIIAKRVETYKKTFREEKVRWKWGLLQRTKIRVSEQPKAKIHQRSYLKANGYIIDEQKCVAYWTPETIRAEKMERGWSKKFKNYYSFKPYEPERQPGSESDTGL